MSTSDELRVLASHSALTSFKEARGSAEQSELEYVAITRGLLRQLANRVALLETGQCATCAEQREDEIPRATPDRDIPRPASPDDLPAVSSAPSNYDEQRRG